MHLSISLLAAVTLGLSGVTEAICTGQTLGIGTGVNLASGNTQCKSSSRTLPTFCDNQYCVRCVPLFTDNSLGKIYDTGCNVKDTYAQPTAINYCDSSRFYCNFGTKDIGQYDDPKTGWAYNCTKSATAENCGGDAIIDCVSSHHRLPPVESSRGLHHPPPPRNRTQLTDPCTIFGK